MAETRKPRKATAKRPVKKPDSTPTSYPWRPSNDATYSVARAASDATGMSINSVLTSALSYYVEHGGLDADIQKARSKQDDAIRKLAGG